MPRATDQQKLHKRLVELARGMDGYTSRPILDYFTEQPELPAETREVLSAALEDMPYFAVHRILEMLAKNKQPAKVEANIVQLLDHDNFFIARRLRVSAGAEERQRRPGEADRVSQAVWRQAVDEMWTIIVLFPETEPWLHPMDKPSLAHP